jgi:protoporphyrinogen oxidase
LVGLYLRLTKNWKPLERETAAAWMRRWAGDRVYESMWEPMMVSKFGERYGQQVNMAWLWARLHTRTSRLGSFVGGFQAFRMCRRSCAPARWKIHLVFRAEYQRRRAVALVTGQGEATCDRVLSTTSPALFAQLAPRCRTYRDGPQAKSMGAVVMVVASSIGSPESLSIFKGAGFRSWRSSSTPTTSRPTTTVAITSCTAVGRIIRISTSPG